MIPSGEALKIVLNNVRPLATETVSWHDACGRILAKDVVCDMDMPPFNKSAMDGYACRREDLPGPLHVIETIPAGVTPTQEAAPGECAKIMTGAEVPEGADCVIMVEHTKEEDENYIRFTKTTTDTNICYHGEDVQSGDIVLQRGTRLAPRHIPVLTGTGCVRPEVAVQPKVGIIATGNELVEPECLPGISQIRNTNSGQLRAQVEQIGAAVTYYGIVPDVESELDATLKCAMEANDVVLFSGGVSMGDYDFVPDVMTRNGIDILFDSLAMKPGKPTTFGVGASTYCFGLPGNPVSAFLQCETLVKPFLFALMGHAFQAPWTEKRIAETYTRKKTAREAWIPVTLSKEGIVQPTSYHGSAHIAALTDIFGFMIIPQSIASISKGDKVTVWVL